MSTESRFYQSFDKKKLYFINKIGSYEPLYTLYRLGIVSVLATVICFITLFIIDSEHLLIKNRFYVHLIFILAFNVLSEGNVLIAHVIHKRTRSKFSIATKTFIVAFFSFVLALVIFAFAQFVFGRRNLLQNEISTQILMFGVTFIILSHVIRLVIELLSDVVDAQEEIAALKTAKLQSDYNLLQDRLNPHFLFNNLSVLKSLIRYDTKLAEQFTENFTDVYRYLLKSHEKRTTTLHDEIEFVGAYLALHKERIGDGLVIQVNVDSDKLKFEVPPMSVQLLVENAIKHNIARRAAPLRIEIFSEDQFVIVRNNLNLKTTTYSTKTGLATLEAQYAMISLRPISYNITPDFYQVGLPLL